MSNYKSMFTREKMLEWITCLKHRMPSKNKTKNIIFAALEQAPILTIYLTTKQALLARINSCSIRVSWNIVYLGRFIKNQQKCLTKISTQGKHTLLCSKNNKQKIFNIYSKKCSIIIGKIIT